jgi:LAO/AO transport system kinase
MGDDFLADLKAGGKPALARALAQLEQSPDMPETLALLGAAYAAPHAAVIGLTGPPGVGKSSLMNGLIRYWRRQGLRIGCIAVDPSSQRSGGALLGDRTRLTTDPADDGVFFRSMAARDRLGGLANLTFGAMVLMRALFDRVMIETVGVGQSETEIKSIADLVLLCVQPGSGDHIQYMKAGIAEIPDLVAVTKADMGTAAGRAKADVEGALGLSPGRVSPVLLTAISDASSIASLAEAIDQIIADCQDALPHRRHSQAEGWLATAIRERFGKDGLRRAGPMPLNPGQSPFDRVAQLANKLSC